MTRHYAVREGTDECVLVKVGCDWPGCEKQRARHIGDRGWPARDGIWVVIDCGERLWDYCPAHVGEGLARDRVAQ
jgi:hypothetical protein